MAPERDSLLATLYERLAPAAREALDRAVAAATDDRLELYLVGGAVRDLLLDAGHLDLDLVVEGDAIALARDVAAGSKARVAGHPRFGTAVVRGEGYRLDIATARSEVYERPGALPSVRPASIEADLARRDFTINAMALLLNGSRPGDVIDPADGRADLRAGLVRVLHGGSFADDATRILRAVRYSARLGFAIEQHTSLLLTRGLDQLDTISGARLRHEFERIADEERPSDVLRLAERLGVLVAAHPAIRPDARCIKAADALSGLPATRRDAALFCLLFANATPQEAEAATRRLALTGRQGAAVRSFQALREDEPKLQRPLLQPSDVVTLLEGRAPAAIDALIAIADAEVAGLARRYRDEWRQVRPRLNGDDVEGLGVPHGPDVGRVLEGLRRARLDGITQSRDDEIDLVRAGRDARSMAGARRE